MKCILSSLTSTNKSSTSTCGLKDVTSRRHFQKICAFFFFHVSSLNSVFVFSSVARLADGQRKDTGDDGESHTQEASRLTKSTSKSTSKYQEVWLDIHPCLRIFLFCVFFSGMLCLCGARIKLKQCMLRGGCAVYWQNAPDHPAYFYSYS